MRADPRLGAFRRANRSNTTVTQLEMSNGCSTRLMLAGVRAMEKNWPRPSGCPRRATLANPSKKHW